MSLCIRGVDILDPAGGADRLDRSILVDQGRIAAIQASDIRPPAGTRVVQASGAVALPGLVNTHNHVAMTLLRSYGADLPLQRWLEERIWPAEVRLTDEDVHLGALLGCLEMLRGGITAFADMYDHMDAVADAVVQSGMRAALSRGVIGLKPTWPAALAEGEALCRRIAAERSGLLTGMIAPHAEYTCPPPVWREAVALARGLGVRLHTHVSETATEVEGCRLRHGCSPVRFLQEAGVMDAGLLAAHCVHVDAEDIGLLAQPGVAVAHNPVSNAKLGSGVAPIPVMRAAGVRVGLGSDGAASTDFLGLWDEMRLSAWMQKATLRDAAAMPCRDVLRMATADGARALGLPPGCGTLAVGAPADLIVVDVGGLHQRPSADRAASLLYCARDADVLLTIVAGQVVMERGAFPGIDHERVAARAAERSRRLLEEL